MLTLLVEVFVLAALATQITREFGLQRSTTAGILLLIGAVLYVLNSLLIRHYIAKRAPDFASHEEVRPGVQMWELTAGWGVVPRWVSRLGILGLAFLITAGIGFIGVVVSFLRGRS